MVMVQEFADGGDLFALLQKHGGRLGERVAVSLVLEPFLRVLQVGGWRYWAFSFEGGGAFFWEALAAPRGRGGLGGRLEGGMKGVPAAPAARAREAREQGGQQQRSPLRRCAPRRAGRGARTRPPKSRAWSNPPTPSTA